MPVHVGEDVDGGGGFATAVEDVDVWVDLIGDGKEGEWGAFAVDPADREGGVGEGDGGD